ncbi:FecR family protein [Sphingomonas sp. Leaf21]|uniref:FecR family protein n=1 Tax=Sphingomonas sp. Leaf21 TaxID=2876550 RepID=UPI001E513379|nr:FecR domain-containing protein [Sphingomonas sp. Leaf21]
MADDRRLQREAAAWLARLQAPDGERDRARFEAWRNADPAHSAAFARVERHWQDSTIMARSGLRYGAPLTRPWWHVGASTPARLAFGSAAAMALVVAAWSISDAPRVVGPERVASAVGQLRNIRLPDGSRVTLDTDSTLAIRYSAQVRQLVLEQGRARFTVAHDPRRPFIVAAGAMTVVAHGTVFDVDTRASGAGVTLIQGIVEVIARSAKSPEQRVRLTAGKQVTATADMTRLSAPRTVPAGATGWTSGMLGFDSAPLDRVVAEANSYTSTKLVLADPMLARLRVTGAFPADKPEDLAASLARMFGLRVETRADGAILLLPTGGTSRASQGG